MFNGMCCVVLSTAGAVYKTATAKYSKETAEMYIAVIFKGMD